MSRNPVQGRTLFFDYQAIPRNDYCCEQMRYHHSCGEKIIFYIPQYREYGIRVTDTIYQKINSCPWCSRAFSVSLKEKFFDVLSENMEKEIGIDDLDQAPPEFKTDEWWKNRRL